jgi:hypothetical protein
MKTFDIPELITAERSTFPDDAYQPPRQARLKAAASVASFSAESIRLNAINVFQIVGVDHMQKHSNAIADLKNNIGIGPR